MRNLFELHEKYKRSQKSYRAKEKKLDKQIEELEAKKKRMRYPHFMLFLDKLGKQVLPRIKGAVNFELLGPFGLGHEVAIHFYGPGDEKKRKIVASATFQSYGDGYALKNYSKKTNRFPKGSLGEFNRMNYELIEISKDMNIDWFIKFMRKK